MKKKIKKKNKKIQKIQKIALNIALVGLISVATYSSVPGLAPTRSLRSSFSTKYEHFGNSPICSHFTPLISVAQKWVSSALFPRRIACQCLMSYVLCLMSLCLGVRVLVFGGERARRESESARSLLLSAATLLLRRCPPPFLSSAALFLCRRPRTHCRFDCTRREISWQWRHLG